MPRGEWSLDRVGLLWSQCMTRERINYRCRYYRGAIPCVFNKTEGAECPSCAHASEYKQRILFIKLDAVGDVLRSASLLPAIVAMHDAPFISWVTRSESVELVRMMQFVDEVIPFTNDGMARIMAGGWDRVYSLSNDLTSASIASVAGSAETVIGFYMHDGSITPSNAAAEHWLEMAAFDRVKKANEHSYQRLMLRIVGCPEHAIAAPALNVDAALQEAAAARLSQLFPRDRRRRVAINVGAGGRWPKKMLDTAQIYQFAKLLHAAADVDVVLTGGAGEVEKAATILSMFEGSDRIGAALTQTSLAEFVALLSQVDVLLCGDTLALHIASAIGLPTIAVFGPTSLAEIFDYDGLVKKIATDKLDCLVCYGDCNKEHNCMSLLDIPDLVSQTLAQLDAGAVRVAGATKIA
jgi:ADP-heptose:LPS heptosyltransferase